MSRNDIRLRRQRLAGGGSHRFRNYDTVLQRHERDMRIKKIVKVFTYFAIILIVVMLLIIVTRTAERLDNEPGTEAPRRSKNDKAIVYNDQIDPMNLSVHYCAFSGLPA